MSTRFTIIRFNRQYATCGSHRLDCNTRVYSTKNIQITTKSTDNIQYVDSNWASRGKKGLWQKLNMVAPT